MRKALIATFVALAIPAAASAHDGRHHHHHHHHHALYARLSGTGTLGSAHGSIASTKLGTGTFTSAVTTTGASTTHTGDRGTLSCAPATDALTLVGSSTVSLTLTGKSCTWTAAGSTTSTSMFFGRGSNAKAFLVAKSDGTVKGAVFMGVDRSLFSQFSVRERDALHHAGDCDH
jgi:hypothetical protein